MSQFNIDDIEAMSEIETSLTQRNVQALQTILNIPSATIENSGNQPLDFLNSLRYDFPQFDSVKFLDALGSIGRKDIIPSVQKLSWIKVSSKGKRQLHQLKHSYSC